MKLIACKIGAAICLLVCMASVARAELPNILFCISDDQSYWHTGANGDQVIKTPAFDRVAKEGIRFTHAFCDAPTCGPSRSAILTGQHIWRLEEAGNIHSTLPAHFATYPAMLEKQGYVTGFTGKGWSPSRLEAGGRTENPAGKEYSHNRLQPPQRGISNNDYTSNFEDFLDQRPKNAPFCFGSERMSHTETTSKVRDWRSAKIHPKSLCQNLFPTHHWYVMTSLTTTPR